MATNTTLTTALDMNRVMQDILKKTDIRFQKKADLIAQDIFRNLFGSILEDTPVNDANPEDMGKTKANWQLTRVTPASGVLERRQPDRDRRYLRIPSRGIFKTKAWFFTNNVPWIRMLEFGGYAESIRGTWNRATGRFEKRTAGGYSLQAPNGMVRKNVLKYRRFVNEAVNKFAQRRI